MDTEQYRWLQFAPELPSLGEFAVIFLYAGALVLVGRWLKNWWEKDNEAVPIPVALGMGAAMLCMYFLLIAVFYFKTRGEHAVGTVTLEDGRQMAVLSPSGDYLGILVWCMIALVFPLFYYGLIIVNAFTSRVIDRVSPFGMQIHEPSEFAEARKMALRGDVDGAVKRYRAYLDNTEGALFEAARLLKSEDRFAEAAALFQEIRDRFYGKKLVWSEATYHLAKIRESHLHQTGEAMSLLGQIIDRTPDTRFGQLAQTEYTRMEALYGEAVPAPQEEKTRIPDTDDPFFANRQGMSDSGGDNGQYRADNSVDAPVPPVDPFFAAAQKRMQEDDAENEARGGAGSGGADEPKKRPAAKKKNPAKKKAAAKKKATAKKKPAAKKKSATKPKPKTDS